MPCLCSIQAEHQEQVPRPFERRVTGCPPCGLFLDRGEDEVAQAGNGAHESRRVQVCCDAGRPSRMLAGAGPMEAGAALTSPPWGKLSTSGKVKKSAIMVRVLNQSPSFAVACRFHQARLGLRWPFCGPRHDQLCRARGAQAPLQAAGPKPPSHAHHRTTLHSPLPPRSPNHYLHLMLSNLRATKPRGQAFAIRSTEWTLGGNAGCGDRCGEIWQWLVGREQQGRTDTTQQNTSRIHALGQEPVACAACQG